MADGPPVVHAAAPRGNVLPVVHLGPLLAEHGHLVPHEGESAAVNLNNEKNFSFNVNQSLRDYVRAERVL